MGSGHSTATSNGALFSGRLEPVNVAENIATAPYTLNSTTKAKKALLIGINYRGTINELYGCINDVYTVKSYIDTLGYQCITMTDNESGSLYPTADNILTQLNSLVTSLTDGDSLIVYYSGHGTRIIDTNGDEVSNRDSCIVPINYGNGLISDDMIRNILSKSVSGSKIFSCFDSCNSESVCDLRCNLYDGAYSEVTNNSNLTQGTNMIINNKYSQTNGHIISLAASRDNQLAVEFYINGNPGGAMTYALISYLKQNTPNVSLNTLLQGVKSRISGWGLSQVTELMSGREDILTNFSSLATFLNV